MTRYVTYAEVVAYHREILLSMGQSPLLIAPERLEAAIARPATTAFGEDAFPTLSEKAAVLLQSIVIGHPFADGNKRAGSAAILAFLQEHDVTMPDYSDDLYDFVIAVTTGELREVADIAARLRELFPGLD